MSIPIKILRLYSMSDADMLNYARTRHYFFSEDIADFTAFDGALDNDYADDFLAKIENAENFNSDDQMIDIVAQSTLNVHLKMTECRKYYQKMKYFIVEAFPGMTGTWNEFGFNDYAKSRASQTRLIQFMLDLHETAVKYTTELEGVNFDQSRIDEIKTLAVELQTSKTMQGASKGNRSTQTNNRVILLNLAWLSLQRIRRAAKAIYQDNYGKYVLYLLPSEGGSVSPVIEITGSVSHGQTIQINVPVLTPQTFLAISNIGPVALDFCGGTDIATPCSSALTLNPGDSASVSLESITPVGVVPTMLKVSHNIAPPGSPDGEFMVVPTN
jgi:hypothetical protein